MPEETDFERRMREAVEEMNSGGFLDPTAAPQVYPAELGTSVSALSSVPSASPKHARHDVPYERIRNKHTHLESIEVEAALAYVLGEDVYESAPQFEGFSRERLNEVLAMSREEIDTLVDREDPLRPDYYDADEDEGDE